MNLDDLNELYLWCQEHRVLHVEYMGVKLTLHPDAIPPLPSVRPDDAKDIEWDDGIDRVSPQEQIRREYAKQAEETP